MSTSPITRRLRRLGGPALLLLLCGCGGGTASGPSVGQLSATITWPAGSGRLVPSASQSVKIQVLKADGSAFSPAKETVINRPDTSATLSEITAGSVLVRATAYPQAGAAGVAQAAGEKAATVTAGQNATVALTMNSTVARVVISPSPATVLVGGTATLTATAQDAAGATVLVATTGAFTWSVTAGATCASVDATSGQVTGKAAGSATAQATEQESAQSGTVTVQVNAAPSSVTYAVVDTAQSRCYDAQGQISAPAAGQAFYGQDAQHQGLQPSYTLSGDGLTVHDNRTGLDWQRSPDTSGDGSIKASDKLNWTQAQARPATLNAARFGGFSDWRLPSIKELYSLINFNGTDPSPTSTGTAGLTPFIDTACFQFAYGDTSAGERVIDAQYASSTLYVGNTANDGGGTLFGVNFADGRIKGYGLVMQGQPKTFYVICVRGSTYGVNDFADNGDGTITDRATGLMWIKADSGSGLNWQDALAWVQTKNAARYLGYTDWRLPEAKELQSIVDYTRSPSTTASPALSAVFGATAITNEAGQTDYPCYWTSTTHISASGSGAAGVYIAFGRAMGYMNNTWVDVHGAGAQRSDPKYGNPADYPTGRGPQGDAVRIFCYVRLVRG